MGNESHVVWHQPTVQRPRGCVVWFTGLSGSGKSTVANAVDNRLHRQGIPSAVLDGDNVRHGLNASSEKLVEEFGASFAKRFGLGFSAEDRTENIRRIGAVAEMFCAAGLLTLTAFVSPRRSDRDRVRRVIEAQGKPGDFVEVFVDTSIEICERRDPKGLYKMARAGKIKDFTGIDAPYEPPVKPEVTLAAGASSIDPLVDEVVQYLRDAGKLS